MNQEKSCGAVIYRTQSGQTEYLLVKSARRNHWGFPKGHMEPGEDEITTALREVREETGLTIAIQSGFRAATEYPLGNGRSKEVVFFIGNGTGQAVTVPENEISEYRWLAYPAAFSCLAFDNTRAILTEAQDYLATHQLLKDH